jgi:chemotaxis protein histidine kinase CheA
MWKPLSIVSGVALLAAGGIEYVMVRPQLIAEKTQLANAGGNKKTAEKSRTAMEEAAKTSEADLAKVKDKLTKEEKAKAEAAAKKDEVAKLAEEAAAAKEAASKDLAEVEQKMKDMGGIDTLVAEMKSQEAKRLEYDKQISVAKSAIESSLAGKAVLDKQISEIKRIDNWQQTGTMAAGFRSRITAVNPDWGFVTIGAGNAASVVRQAKLDVVRGSSVVGKIIVTSISPNSSSAEIVPGSVAPGDSILPGDQVKTGAGSMPGSAPAAPSAAKPAPAKAAAPAAPEAAKPAAEADPFAPAVEAPAKPTAEAPAPATEPAPAVDPAMTK